MTTSLRSFSDWYCSSALAAGLREERRLDASLTMMELHNPAGDVSTPASSSLVMIRNFTPGTHHQSDIGAGRFEERSPYGALFVIPPALATQIEAFNAHHLRCLQIDADVAIAGLEGTNREYAGLDFGWLQRGSFRDPAIESLFDTLWHVCETQGRPNRLMADAAIVYIMQRLASLAGTPETPVRGGLAAWQVKRVTEAIAAASEDVLSLRMLADMAGLSPYHFCRAFRRTLGVSPYRYQMMRRVERARTLLEHSDLSITEVALEVGYVSSQAFARSFRSDAGVSPSQYRRQRRS